MWERLSILPQCAHAQDPIKEFSEELPKLLFSLRHSSVFLFSTPGSKRSTLPVGNIPLASRYWCSVLSTAFDVAKFVFMLDKEEELAASGAVQRSLLKGIVGTNENMFFSDGVKIIWWKQLNKHLLINSECATIEDALDSSTKSYVQEWFENILVPLQKMNLKAATKDALMKHLDNAVWQLLKMRRLLPFVPEYVRQKLQDYIGRLPKSLRYMQDKVLPIYSHIQ